MKYICIFQLVLTCLLVARKENLTDVLTGLTGRSKNLNPTGNPTGWSTSSVAWGEVGGAIAPLPIGMSTKMQNEKNTTFLTLLRRLEWTK